MAKSNATYDKQFLRRTKAAQRSQSCSDVHGNRLAANSACPDPRARSTELGDRNAGRALDHWLCHARTHLLVLRSNAGRNEARRRHFADRSSPHLEPYEIYHLHRHHGATGGWSSDLRTSSVLIGGGQEAAVWKRRLLVSIRRLHAVCHGMLGHRWIGCSAKRRSGSDRCQKRIRRLRHAKRPFSFSAVNRRRSEMFTNFGGLCCPSLTLFPAAKIWISSCQLVSIRG